MRALVRKYPTNASNHHEEEVWLEDTWHEHWEGFLNENMHYALCENVPDEPVYGDDPEHDIRTDVASYEVTEHTREVPAGESATEGEEPVTTEKYWTARFVGGV